MPWPKNNCTVRTSGKKGRANKELVGCRTFDQKIMHRARLGMIYSKITPSGVSRPCRL